MRVLVLGAASMLARDVIGHAPSGTEIVARARTEADVTDARAVQATIDAVRPDVVVNCAAYNNVDGAEGDHERAYLVNGEAPGIIGRAAARLAQRPHGDGPLVVHFSTDYVFDGRARQPYPEDFAPNPISVYGASKLAGERALSASGAAFLIIRTQWLFGVHGVSFPQTMWRRTAARQPTRVVNDQVGRPTFTGDLATALWRLLTCGGGERRLGLVHIANSGTATWFDVAQRVFQAAGVPELVSACSTADYATPATRPAYSVLDTSWFEATVGSPLPNWEDALRRFLEVLRC